MAVTTAGFVHVQHPTAATFSSVATASQTVASTGTNHLLVVNIVFTGATPSAVSVTDNASTPNTYTSQVSAGTTGTGGDCIIYQFSGIQVNAATSVTANWTTNASGTIMSDEFSGGATSSYADISATIVQGTGSSNQAFSSFSPTSSNELVVVCYGFTSATTPTAGSGYTLGATGSQSTTTEYRLANSSSETAPMSTSNSRAYTGVAVCYFMAPTSGWTVLNQFTTAISGATLTLAGVATANALLVLYVSHNSSTAISTPSGWTPLAAGIAWNSSGNWGGMFYKLAAGTETSIVTGASGTVNSACMQILGNANPIATDGTSGAQQTTGATSYATPTITTTKAGSLILVFENPRSASGITGWTTSTEFSSAGLADAVFGVYVPGVTESGWSDTLTWTTSSSVISFIQAFQAPTTSTTNSNFLMFM